MGSSFPNEKDRYIFPVFFITCATAYQKNISVLELLPFKGQEPVFA
jgi:hypothetical protein